MAEYLIQSETLDNIAEAINAKTGGSSAMTPAQMVTAIGTISGGGDTKDVNAFVAGTWWPSRVVIDTATVMNQYALNSCYGMNVLVIGAQVQTCGAYPVNNNGDLTTVVDKSYVVGAVAAPYIRNAALSIIDTALTSIGGLGFQYCTSLNKIILRSSTLVPMANTNIFNSTPFASGNPGGTIYVPRTLISEYQNATNWSTFSNITWTAIEDSVYANQYADGTPIT